MMTRKLRSKIQCIFGMCIVYSLYWVIYIYIYKIFTSYLYVLFVLVTINEYVRNMGNERMFIIG